MTIIIPLLQLIVALSVLYVWIFKQQNIREDFNKFKLSQLTMNLVGFSKVILSSLLIISIWINDFLFISAFLMALFMLAAQYFHIKVNNPIDKKLPSIVFLIICILIMVWPY